MTRLTLAQGMVDTEEIWEEIAADGTKTRLPSPEEEQEDAKKRKSASQPAFGSKVGLPPSDQTLFAVAIVRRWWSG